MGNPNIKETLNVYNLDTLRNGGDIKTITDYRKYILQTLPHLQYLDGIHRNSILRLLDCSTNRTSDLDSPPPNSTQNCPSTHIQQSNKNGNWKISPSLSFKGLFQLTRRKMSYPSSSTN